MVRREDMGGDTLIQTSFDQNRNGHIIYGERSIERCRTFDVLELELIVEGSLK